MKKLITIISIFITLTSFAQTANDYLESGIQKHNIQDFKGAIKDYSNAIKLDKNLMDAFYNRGSCELALKDFKAAMSDFDKTIELDPKFTKAYYSRATVYASQNKYSECLPDLNKTIELEPSFPNALTLRGQILAQSGDKEGACKDFGKAKDFGNIQAEKYIIQFCGGKAIDESFMLDWPESDNWKIGNTQETKEMEMVELIHKNETLENWTELGTMMSIKGALNIPMDKVMNLMYEQSKKVSPKATLTFIEKDDAAEYPYIIFTIENPSFKNDKTPESQLWYITQGKTALYSNFIAVKQATISTELKNKWIPFFKSGKVVTK